MQNTDEAISEIKDKLEGIAERAKDADSRLENYFNTPKAEEQPEPMPSSDQTKELPKEVKTDVSKTEVETAVEDSKPELIVNEEDEALSNSKNPERTKAYIEKLKQERDEALKKSQVVEPEVNNGNSVFDIFHPEGNNLPTQPQTPVVPAPYLNPLQKDTLVNQFIDAEGNVDIAGLNNALAEANRRSYDAYLAAESSNQKIARIEENMEIKEVHSEFPEIDPMRKDKFDKTLFRNVQARLITNFATNKKERLLDIVREESKLLRPQQEVNVQQIKNETVQQVKAAQEARNQGPFEGAERQTDSDYEQLRRDTRKGRVDNKALDARLGNYFNTIK